MTQRPIRGFGRVETWVFDLDNTLYPHHLNLWQQVDERIRDYIVDFLKITRDEAFRLQKDYYRRYGTTMRGLMEEHGLEPDEFLEIVHQIDHSPLTPNPALGAAIASSARPQAHPHQRHARTCRRGAGAGSKSGITSKTCSTSGRLSSSPSRGRKSMSVSCPATTSIRIGPRSSRIWPAISKCRMRLA